MAIDRGRIEAARKQLDALTTRNKDKITTKDFVRELAPTIHKKLQDGLTISDVWQSISTMLPEGAKLSESSFKKYWQDARRDQNLEPLKKWKRKERPAPHPLPNKLPPSDPRRRYEGQPSVSMGKVEEQLRRKATQEENSEANKSAGLQSGTRTEFRKIEGEL